MSETKPPSPAVMIFHLLGHFCAAAAFGALAAYAAQPVARAAFSVATVYFLGMALVLLIRYGPALDAWAREHPDNDKY